MLWFLDALFAHGQLGPALLTATSTICYTLQPLGPSITYPDSGLGGNCKYH